MGELRVGGTGPSWSLPGGPGSARSLYDTIVRNIKDGHRRKAGGAPLGEPTSEVRPRLPDIKQQFVARQEPSPVVPGGSQTGPDHLLSQGFHQPPQRRVSYPKQLPVLGQPPAQPPVQPPVQPLVQPPVRPLVQAPLQSPVTRKSSPNDVPGSVSDLYNLVQNSILQKPSVPFTSKHQHSIEIGETQVAPVELPARHQTPTKFAVPHQALPSSQSVLHPNLPPPVPHPRLSKLPSLFPQVREPLQEISPVVHETPEFPEIINISKIPAKKFQEIKETTSLESEYSSEYSSLPQGWSEEDQERLENRINEERLKEIEENRSRELAARNSGQGRFSKRPQPRKN